VRLAGIEPTTPWFVAKYSIQLSYSREKQNYSTAFIVFGSAFFQLLLLRFAPKTSDALNARRRIIA
jgi:hypothetical protein